jgi:hypothetical protein
MEPISVVILIRTDTTLDHSQKAEKVCPLRKQQGHPLHKDINTGGGTLLARDAVAGF